MNIRRVAWSLLVLFLLASTSWAQIGRIGRFGGGVYRPPIGPVGGGLGGSLNNGIGDIPLGRGSTLEPLSPTGLRDRPSSSAAAAVAKEYSSAAVATGSYPGSTSTGGNWKPAPTPPQPTPPPATPSYPPTFQAPVYPSGDPPVDEQYPLVVVADEDEELTVSTATEADETISLGVADAALEAEEDEEASVVWTWFGRIGVTIAVLGAISFIGALIEDNF